MAWAGVVRPERHCFYCNSFSFKCLRGRSRAMSEPLDPEFLKILVCPLSKAPLIQRGDWLYSTDAATRKKYPIRDGIPVMLIDQAVDVDEEEFQRAKAEDEKT